MSIILSMQNIDKTYDSTKALDKVCFEVEAGEVHALIGANGAGKSTLMKILCGELDFNGGEIEFDGRHTSCRSASEMRKAGVIMIHQELCTVKDLTVAQYMYVGREPTKWGIIDDRRMEQDAAELLKYVGAEFPANTRMGDLSIAQQQLVEICKALSVKVKLLIFDEPTTALGERETEKVFEIIRMLKKQGVSIIYISHRLPELFIISDRITVMREGRHIKTLITAVTREQELIYLLAGREITVSKKAAGSVPPDAETVLQVENLSTPQLLDNVCFSLKKGEVLGLVGLMGSGRTETARAICGIDSKTSGKILINGREVSIHSPRDAAKCGICYLSEDRNEEGLIPQRSIIVNTVLSSLDSYQQFFSLNDKDMLKDTVDLNARVKTKYADPHAPVSSLSGGNAQKVIIARWLLRDCPIFIFDEPTKGIDIGAKNEIYQIIAEIAKNGHSILLISSETDEILANCDRMIVLHEGKVSGELSIEEATPEKIMVYATGGNDEKNH